MTDQVIVLGAGGHARVVIEALERLGMRVAGVVAYGLTPTWPKDSVPLLGNDDWLAGRDPALTPLANGIGGLAPMGRHAAIFHSLKDRGFRFVSVVHPAAIVAGGESIGEGTFVAAGAIVQVGASIGRNCIINSGAIVDHDTLIEDHAQIAPGAVLAGGVIVRRGSYVGAGATVLQGRTLGEACQVAAGAVVVEDVAAERTVFGVPAKEKRA